jgi:Cytochrome P460
MLRASLWPLRLVLFLLAASALAFCVLPQDGQNNAAASDRPSDTPAYTPDGRLQPLTHYREWTYLTTGLDMSYTPEPGAAGHSMFDNVFVNPSSYQFFQKTGTWPDGTTLVLEIRGAETGVSINRHGQTQAKEVMGVEVHVKDARLPGGWGFFEFRGPVPAKRTPRPADCYSCHEQHAAVDTTFVQFYPTLVGLAQAKHTLSPAYLKDLASENALPPPVAKRP